MTIVFVLTNGKKIKMRCKEFNLDISPQGHIVKWNATGITRNKPLYLPLENIKMIYRAKTDVASEVAYTNVNTTQENKITEELYKELCLYRAIGTVGECQEAMDKQIKKRIRNMRCACGNMILPLENYCSKCGQKIGTKRI